MYGCSMGGSLAVEETELNSDELPNTGLVNGSLLKSREPSLVSPCGTEEVLVVLPNPKNSAGLLAEVNMDCKAPNGEVVVGAFDSIIKVEAAAPTVTNDGNGVGAVMMLGKILRDEASLSNIAEKGVTLSMSLLVFVVIGGFTFELMGSC